MTPKILKKKPVKHWLALFLLLTTSFIIFGRALNYQFVNFDDPALAYENAQVKSFDLLQMFSSIVAEDYIPLTIFSYAVDHALFGMDPFYFHLHNLLLHCLNVLLVYWLIWLISSGSFSASFLTALMFATHPLHVESVAWVAERKDVLSGFFTLLAMLAYWQFSGQRKWGFYLLSLLCFTLALFAKFMAVSLPAILLLFELHKRSRLQKMLVALGPFAVVAVVFTSIHLALHNSPESSVSISLLRGIDSLVFYLSKTFLPLGLSVFYERNVAAVVWWEYLLAAAVIAGLVVAWWRGRQLRAHLVGGLLFFIATLVPVLQIVPFGNDFAYADRFMYLPSVGLFYVLARLSERRWATGLWLAVGLVWAAMAYERVPIWQSSKSLWTDAVAKFPTSAVARNNLALITLEEARPELAIRELIEATRLRANYAEPYINLGLAYLDIKKIDEAEKALQRALEINPKSTKAHVNMALVLEAQNRLEPAVGYYLRALELDRDLSAARYNLGVIYYRLGQADKALGVFQETLRRDPYLAEAHHGLGVIQLEKGQASAAISAFEAAARLDARYLAPRVQLANIFGQQGRTELVAQQIQEIQRIQKELESQPPTRSRRGP